MIESIVLFGTYVTIMSKLWKELNMLEDLEHERRQIVHQACAIVLTFCLTIVQFTVAIILQYNELYALEVMISSFISFLEKTVAPFWVMLCHY